MTKHFGINTMYSLFSQIYKIYISSFFVFFSFFLSLLYIYMNNKVCSLKVAEQTAESVAPAAQFWCLFMCRARWSEREKLRLHTPHWNGLAPVCFR